MVQRWRSMKNHRIVGLISTCFMISIFVTNCNTQPFSECGDGTIAYSDISNVYLFDVNSKNSRKFDFPDSYITTGSFSPDEKSLIFSDMRNSGLHQMDIESGSVNIISYLNSGSFPFSAKVSPDNSKIAFADGGADNDPTTYIMDYSAPENWDKLEVDFNVSEIPLGWLDENKILLLDRKKIPLSYEERKIQGGEWKYLSNIVIFNLHSRVKNIIYSTNNEIFTGSLDSKNQSIIFIEGYPGAIFLFNLKDNSSQMIEALHEGSSTIVWSPNSKCILFEDNGSISIYSLHSNNVIGTIEKNSERSLIPLDWID